MIPRLRLADRIALALAVTVAGAAFAHQWQYPSALFDAGQYADMGRTIAEQGIFSRFMVSEVRTYGYPLVLGLVHLVAKMTGVPPPVVLFLAQCGAYLLAALLLRQTLTRWSSRVAQCAFVGLMLNYYALFYTPEWLTESLSLTALVLLAAGWLEAYRRQGPLWLMGGLGMLAGFSVMIRPANAFMAVAWVLGTGLILVRRGASRLRTVAGVVLLALLVALPFLPQLAYNVIHFDRWTPLLARDLGKRQQAWGIQYIKYATAMPPIPESAVPYLNPWLTGTVLDVEAPLRWYADHPARGALTVAVHSFNLVDQDLVFTYSRDLDPWYRVPLSVVNHTVVALGLMGLWIGGRRAFHGSVPARDAMAVLLTMVGAMWAMHAWTAVEMRFGLALLAVLFPASAYALTTLRDVRRFSPRAAAVIGVSVYVVAALGLSAWVRDQAPLIRAVVADKDRGDRPLDADGDGIPDDRDVCRIIHAATASGCPASSPPAGTWDNPGDRQLVFVNRNTGYVYALSLDDGADTDHQTLWHGDGPGWQIVGTSDLTGDGQADLLWQKDTGGVRLFTMKGAQRVGEQPVGSTIGDVNWRVAATGDFNGDGQADIVWQHRRAGYVAIWFMAAVDGQTVLQSVSYVTRDGDAAELRGQLRLAGATDFDGDGHRDMVGQDEATGDVFVWHLGARGRWGVPIVQASRLGSASAERLVGAIADVAGDARDDILLQHTTSGEVSVWVRAGGGVERMGTVATPPPDWVLAGPR